MRQRCRRPYAALAAPLEVGCRTPSWRAGGAVVLRQRTWAILLVLALAAVGFQASAEQLSTVSGPIVSQAIGSAPRDYPFFASNQPLATHGYVEEEFFVEGQARRHTSKYPTRTFEGGQFQDKAAVGSGPILCRR